MGAGIRVTQLSACDLGLVGDESRADWVRVYIGNHMCVFNVIWIIGRGQWTCAVPLFSFDGRAGVKPH